MTAFVLSDERRSRQGDVQRSADGRRTFMKPFVCGRFYDRYVIASRLRQRRYIEIGPELYASLLDLSARDSLVPNGLARFLERLETSFSFNSGAGPRLNDLIAFAATKQNRRHYAAASYEITARCNYACRHCIHGGRDGGELEIDDKLKVVTSILATGCLIFRFTGGEPFYASGFDEIYAFVHDSGVLINIATNGSLLAAPRHQKLIADRPPSLLVVSFYGASKTSYEGMTRTEGSFRRFLKAMDWLHEGQLPVRANIIVTSVNEHEVKQMVDLAEEHEFDYFIYHNMSPTFGGSASPLGLTSLDESAQRLATQYNSLSLPLDEISEGETATCLAGKSSFYVTSAGKAVVCCAGRETPGVELLKDEVDPLDSLPAIADSLLSMPSACGRCEHLADKSCKTCAIRLGLHRKANVLPQHVCRKRGAHTLDQDVFRSH
jgi:MoaA/NifB/PqqE/SkfB family radical SAM enzyme